MNSELLDLLLGLLFVPFYLITLKCLSIYSGWSELSKEFGYKGKFSGTLLRCQSVGSGGATHVGVSNEGLYLALLFIFRPFHKPLFIPWERITLAKARIFIYSGYEIRVEGHPRVRLFMPHRTYRKLDDYIPNRCKNFAD